MTNKYLEKIAQRDWGQAGGYSKSDYILPAAATIGAVSALPGAIIGGKGGRMAGGARGALLGALAGGILGNLQFEGRRGMTPEEAALLDAARYDMKSSTNPLTRRAFRIARNDLRDNIARDRAEWSAAKYRDEALAENPGA